MKHKRKHAARRAAGRLSPLLWVSIGITLLLTGCGVSGTLDELGDGEPVSTRSALFLAAAAAMALATIVALAWRLRYERMRAEGAERDCELERRRNRRNMNYFANISHEFRTPLTMVSGPVTQLCDSPNINLHERRLLNIVQRNSARMLRLVNQLTDFNRLEHESAGLRVTRTDAAALTARLIDGLNPGITEKRIALHVEGLTQRREMWVDVDKVEKIATNLLSNALRYSPAGGSIAVSLTVLTGAEARALAGDNGEGVLSDGNYLRLTVGDSGPGIPTEYLHKIFDRYFRLEFDDNDAQWGSGIGLHYSHTLARAHHGCLFARNRSDVPSGAEFTLLLPMDDDVYRDAEKGETEMYTATLPAPAPAAEPPAEAVADGESYSIMVVEDDAEAARYLREQLSASYSVTSVFDAAQAWDEAVEHHPDLILVDVMLPGHDDGLALTRRLKQDERLQHIPVIIVSAKTAVDDQIAGLATGADAYVTKPYNPKYLRTLIDTHLERAARQRALLTRSTDIADPEQEEMLNAADREFMSRLYRLMEDELANVDLDVNFLTDRLHISRTKLYYKIKGLTGTSPATFFKTYKLNRAAELILAGNHTMTEISEMTGFANPAHFSTSFKKRFGTTPSTYAQSLQRG